MCFNFGWNRYNTVVNISSKTSISQSLFCLKFNLTGNKTDIEIDSFCNSFPFFNFIIFAKVNRIYVLWPNCKEAVNVLILLDTENSMHERVNRNKCLSKYCVGTAKKKEEIKKSTKNGKQTKGGKKIDVKDVLHINTQRSETSSSARVFFLLEHAII